ncbi:hypothetical protein FZZ93_02880 [Halomonas eurihalina]|uniref:Uncharacterized protein n=1 Tax=Halomonas eurihalina TaxID=42566 RepID=A0A5D9DEU8_HALER|nr:hypothetical protein [Halomonas eurihalina]MDR5857862.1 hypothetical protein [Halomonas eurihalina]TZG41620.1 hypothetical protein FZZ93_02880 [Halomonas eurihalina]
MTFNFHEQQNSRRARRLTALCAMLALTLGTLTMTGCNDGGQAPAEEASSMEQESGSVGSQDQMSNDQEQSGF